MKIKKNWWVRLLIYLAILATTYYVWLPPLHFQSFDFWAYFIFVVLLAAFLLFGGLKKRQRVVRVSNIEKEVAYWAPNKFFLLILKGVAVLVLLLIVGGFLTSSPIFRADSYAHLLEKQPGDFSKDVEEIPWDRIPTIDRDSAVRLGNRKMGEVVELVSQFTVSEEYSQINYKGDPVRVSPLQYASLVKWFTNQSEGIPYYMMVNMINGQTELIRAKAPLRYTKSERLNRNITRHLRFQYPFKLFKNSNFEIDDQGTAYWLTPVYHMRIGLFGGPDVKEMLMTNAQSGETKVYKMDEVPNWVDRAYDADLILNQVNWNGKFQSGFINSVIGQKGVLAATKGYNYLALKDDVYLYTGITSVSADESNIGFILVNMRTKACDFYSVPSAEEFSAMESAQGAVQEKGYKATFPLLLNINSRPTYFLSLKDQAGLIKMYAFIDAEDYQHVVTATSVSEAYKTFSSRSAAKQTEKTDEQNMKQKSGTVGDIQNVVVEGNTVFYFLLEGEESLYTAPVVVSEHLPFVKKGTKVRIEYVPGEKINRVLTLTPEK